MGTARPLSTSARDEPRPGSGRFLLKRLMLGVAWILVSPLVLATLVEDWISTSQRIFGAAKESLALAPGLAGQYMRSAFYASVCRAVSMDARFNFGSLVSSRDVAIGAGTVIGNQSIVGRSSIGRDVLIASRVSILSDPYLHGRPGNRAAGIEGTKPASPPVIGDGCWIGENAVVMADLGARCSVAAGAVVVRPAEPGTTLMGNPARKVNL